MKDSPQVSVVSVWYNQARYVEEFVESLQNQTFTDLEAVFVDGGSSDGLHEVLVPLCERVGFNCLYLRRPDRGFSLNTSRNYGLDASRGQCVLFMDGDMLPARELLERHRRNILEGAQCSVGSRIRAPHLGIASDERYHVFQDGRWEETPFLYAFGCNLAFDRRFLDDHALRFDESYDGHYGLDDIDMAYRCYKAGAVFRYDAYASAVHMPVDYPDVGKLDQCLSNFRKFRKYHFVTGIVQSGPVFFEHKYNADLYRQLLGGEVPVATNVIRIAAPRADDRPPFKEVGSGKPTFIIAEAGLNHNGSFEIAKKMVELAALAGADCIKFQKRDVDQMATRHIYDTTPTPIPELGATYREVRERHELTLEQFAALKTIAERLGLMFMITPFDLQSVDICERLGVTCYKIASHSMTDLPTLRRVASLKKLLFVSTGMSTPEEVDIAVRTIREYHDTFVLMHCVSSYPQKDEDTNLSLLDYLRDRYKCLVGYSGHEEDTIITAGSVLKNAVAVERHFTLDKNMPGFDHTLSLDPPELFALCRQVRRLEKAIGIPEKRLLACETRAREAYRRSLVTVARLPEGHVLSEKDVTVKEPGTGIPPYLIEKVVGRVLARPIDADVTLEWSYLKA